MYEKKHEEVSNITANILRNLYIMYLIKYSLSLI